MAYMNVNHKIRLLYISSVNLRWTHLEWVCEHLDRERFELSFLLLSSAQRPPFLEPYLTARHIPFRRFDCRTTSRSFFATVAEVRRHCRETRAEIVHTHIFFASLVGLLGAFLAGVPVRVNTRHHLRSKHGRAGIWLDRLTNALATRIIATSELLRRQLVDSEGAAPRKVSLVHLGIDIDRFRAAPAEEVRELAHKYNPGGGSPVIGVVARHIKSKGIQYIIPAFRRLLERYPSAFLVLAYRFGHYQVEIRRLLADVPADRYVSLEFEENIFALYKTFDIVVHVPIAEELESFGLIYIEALAAGRAGIFTRAGVARELLVHGQNSWLVDYRDSGQIHDGMVRLLADPELRRSLEREGLHSVDPAFSAKTMVRALERIYLDDLAAAARRERRSLMPATGAEAQVEP
jgi:glycosyltransferase involved in cell wall biosynthesis